MIVQYVVSANAVKIRAAAAAAAVVTAPETAVYLRPVTFAPWKIESLFVESVFIANLLLRSASLGEGVRL